MSQDPPKTKKPSNTAFKQQRLKAWQPILTPKTVLPTFFIIGILFVPLGIGLFIASERVNQIVFDYTNCKVDAPSDFQDVSNMGPILRWKFDQATSNCTIQFSIDTTLTKPVFMYYRLTNFYQNHRRYVKSFDADQLRGAIITDPNSSLTTCDPIRFARINDDTPLTYPDGTVTDINAQIYPCGLIANSLFTDEISDLNSSNVLSNPDLDVIYKFDQNGISWPSDAEKFGRSQWLDSPENADRIPRFLVPPPRWRTAYPDLWGNGYNASNLPNLKEWERLHVWMRTAGLPNFRKLWGRNDVFDLPAATWEVSIQDKFDVITFGGTKSIVISTISILGGKNPFLGVAYITVGGVCILLGIIFLIRHMVKPRKLGDHSYLSWNQPPPGLKMN